MTRPFSRAGRDWVPMTERRDCCGGWAGSGCTVTILLQPSLDEAARRLGHVEETNADAAARVLPGNLPRQADQLLLPGKGKLEINLACWRNSAAGLERSSAVAEVGQSGAQFGRSGTGNVGRRTDGRAGSAAAFAAHEAAGGAQADAGALGRKRAIENKIGAEPEHGAGVELAIDNRNQHAAAVLGGLTQARQEFLGTLVGAIVEDDSVEVLAVDQFQPAGNRRRVLGRHPQFGQDECEQAGRVLIRAHHEGA